MTDRTNSARRKKWLSDPTNRERDREATRERYHRRKKRLQEAARRGELPL